MLCYDTTIHTYLTTFYNFKKTQIDFFFVKRIYYINHLKYTKRLKIDHKKEDMFFMKINTYFNPYLMIYIQHTI